MTNTQPVSSNTVQAGPISVALKLDSWTAFRAAIDEAIIKIKQDYFRVPRYGGEDAWRERAYCYELYHLLRDELPKNFPYTLHGEIDKIGHEAVVRHFGNMKRPNPDFLLHNPGDMGGKANLVIVEVKRSDADPKLIKKDLWKIRKFIKHVGYQRGLMMFFGEQTPPDLFHLGGIEAIWHRVVGQKPMVSNKGKFT